MLDSSRRQWRGRSRTLYPVTVLAVPDAIEAGRVEGIVLPVKREKDGIAQLVGKPALDPSAIWIRQQERRGATELHTHRPDAVAHAPRIIDDLAGNR